jgi:hypothetical protein
MNDLRPELKAKYFEMAGEHLLLLANEKLNAATSSLEGADVSFGIGELLDIFPVLDKSKALFGSSKDAWEKAGSRFSEEYDRVVERTRHCERDEREVSRAFADAVEAWAKAKNPTELQRRILAHELERQARGWPVRDLVMAFASDGFLRRPASWGGTEFSWMPRHEPG